MATLGLIGSGNIGGALARLAVDAGLDVVLSNSRGPETLAGLVSQLGPRAAAGTARQAAEAGDWVVLTIPMRNYWQVEKDPLAGKTLLDTTNYYPERDGPIAGLDSGETTSSELLQSYFEQSHLVKVFNNIFFKHLVGLARPSGAADRSALAIAGDSEQARAATVTLLDTLGYDTVDAGALSEGRRFQPGTPAYGVPYLKDPSTPFFEDPGRPGDAATVREALAAGR